MAKLSCHHADPAKSSEAATQGPHAHSSGTCPQKVHFLDSEDHARQTWGHGLGKIRSWDVGLMTDPAAELAELAPKQ